jgi:hypothetical protein
MTKANACVYRTAQRYIGTASATMKDILDDADANVSQSRREWMEFSGASVGSFHILLFI